MRHDYTFAEVLKYTDVSRNRLMRWADAGIIHTGGGGSQGKPRQFSLRSLAEIRVCDDLRIGGFSEPGLRRVVESLNTVWDQPDDPIGPGQDAPKYRDATILWLAFQRHIIDDAGTIFEHVAIYPLDAAGLVSRVTDGNQDGSGVAETGIAIPIGRIIADLERRTGDVFDDDATLRRQLRETFRDALNGRQTNGGERS